MNSNAKLSHGPLLGWKTEQSRPFIGFHPGEPKAVSGQNPQPLRIPVESHLITVAPTGSWKGRGVLLPTLLDTPNNAIVIDVKGEAYQVTHKYRRDVLGHRIVVFDSFHVVTPDGGDSINPLDLFACDLASDVLDKALMMVELIRGGISPDLKDPFWDKWAAMLLAALITYIVLFEPPEKRNLNTLFGYFGSDFDYTLATWLDSGRIPKQSRTYATFVQYLQMPERETRPSVLATAVCNCAPLASDAVGRSLTHTSFDLNGFRLGTVPMTIYIIIPPSKLLSHCGLLRLVLGSLMTAITTRNETPREKTLLLVDEAAALGPMRQLQEAITLLRGYGIQIHSFWQDLQQLQMLYPSAWQTILNNCAVQQIFGIQTHLAARELANVLGIDTQRILGLAPDEQLIVSQGNCIQTAKKLDYLKDKYFAGRWSPNPMYAQMNLDHGLAAPHRKRR